MFPNPIKDQLIFVLPKTALNANVGIINQNGSAVIGEKFGTLIEGASNTINVSVLPKGLYMIQITEGNMLITKNSLCSKVSYGLYNKKSR